MRLPDSQKTKLTERESKDRYERRLQEEYSELCSDPVMRKVLRLLEVKSELEAFDAERKLVNG